METIFNLA